MSAAPLIIEIVGLFLVVLYLLNRYSNFKQQNVITLIATFIAWYFSFMIIFLLPLDISLTTYRQCLKEQPVPVINNSTNTSNEYPCKEPWSWISPNVFSVLWRIIYWTSQALTWLILPFMQSFSQSGEFSFSGKMRGALIANAIYYGTYLAIFGVLLIYVAIKHNIDAQKLKVIGITASNTWGLFLLVLLLGYGLVAVPRSIWFRSMTSLHLKQIYFKLAKLHSEKCEAEENLEDILNEIKTIAEKIRYNHPLRECVELIVKKCPESFRNNLRRNIEDYNDYNESNDQRDIPNEKSLVSLHSRLIKCLQINNRTNNQWSIIVQEAFQVEDVLLNESNSNRSFMTTMPIQKNIAYQKICNPTLEWFFYCIIQKYVLKLVSILLIALTIAVIWSESTFFNKKPVLSLFALFLDVSRQKYNYFAIEALCCLTIAYLAFCAYYSIFKMRIFNFYYLTPNHQTNEYSLIFSGTLVCRLTSPLCYNFLGLVHLDSHITKDERIVETEFTRIMGHMDVISFISDGFNIYFPMLIILLCLATFFNLGGRILHFFGFEHFFGDADVTQDLIEDGKNLVKREKRRIQRNDPEVQIRHRDVADRLRTNYSSSAGLNTTTRSFGSYNNLNSDNSTNNNASNGSRSNINHLTSSATTTITKGFKSVKDIIASKVPNFIYKPKPDMREYRDIPPYRDNPNDEEYISVNSNDDSLATLNNFNNNKSRLRDNNDVLNDYEDANKNIFDNKTTLNQNKNIRGIFDDV